MGKEENSQGRDTEETGGEGGIQLRLRTWGSGEEAGRGWSNIMRMDTGEKAGASVRWSVSSEQQTLGTREGCGSEWRHSGKGRGQELGGGGRRGTLEKGEGTGAGGGGVTEEVGAASKVRAPQSQALRGGIGEAGYPRRGVSGAEWGTSDRGGPGKGSHAGAGGLRGHSHLRMFRPPRQGSG